MCLSSSGDDDGGIIESEDNKQAHKSGLRRANDLPQVKCGWNTAPGKLHVLFCQRLNASAQFSLPLCAWTFLLPLLSFSWDAEWTLITANGARPYKSERHPQQRSLHLFPKGFLQSDNILAYIDIRMQNNTSVASHMQLTSARITAWHQIWPIKLHHTDTKNRNLKLRN